MNLLLRSVFILILGSSSLVHGVEIEPVAIPNGRAHLTQISGENVPDCSEVVLTLYKGRFFLIQVSFLSRGRKILCSE